ncbi:MAG TPA: hypothetical protein VGX03_23515 [Candidatus Binatia bacterium]|nr:hypothetical protein [Candidatus Binatia bacterium]
MQHSVYGQLSDEELVFFVAFYMARLSDVRSTGNGYIARCPAHDDQHPSLSISTGKDGQVLINCHASCTAEQIVSAVGLTLADLFPEDGKRGGLKHPQNHSNLRTPPG